MRQAPTQSDPIRAYECPLVDSWLLGRPFAGARVPFFAATVLDGLRLVSNEYAAINSVCYGDPFEDCQHGGGGQCFRTLNNCCQWPPRSMQQHLWLWAVSR